ncbi:MAG: T9SS type A sorting domain-containing protein [Bacteroidota bacterium]
MKHLAILLFLLGLSFPALSCSFHVDDFCTTVSTYPHRPVILGKLISEIDHGVQVQVLQVFRGTVEEQCIIIRDGETFECNGTFSRRAIHLFGEQQDEAVLLLSPIETAVHPWEQVGEYSNRDVPFVTPSLVNDGGLLSGAFTYDQVSGVSVFGFPFTEFMDRVQECAPGNWELSYPDDRTAVCKEENSQDPRIFFVAAYPNPVTHSLTVDVGAEIEGEVELYDFRARLVYASRSSSWPVEISVSHLPPGIYILLYKLGDGILRQQKILKQT